MSPAAPVRRLARVSCIVCGGHVAHLELVPPGRLPAGYRGWDDLRRVFFLNHRDPRRWWLIYSGLTETDDGRNVAVDEAGRISRAFARPRSYDRVRSAGLGDDAGYCAGCRVPYCLNHWDLAADGYRTCPRAHRTRFER